MIRQFSNLDDEAAVITQPDFSERLQRIIVAEAARPFQPRPLLHGTEQFAEAWLAKWHRMEHGWRGRAVSCYFASDAVISGTGQIWLGDRLLTSGALMPQYVRTGLQLDRGGSEVLKGNATLPIRPIAEPCILLAGHGVRIYGHFLTETFLRLRVAQKALQGSSVKCKVLLEKNSPDWLTGILREYLGVRPNDFEFFDSSAERVLLRKAVLPELPRDQEFFHPLAAQIADELGEELRIREKAPEAERIFVSRSLFSNSHHDQRKCSNESELMRIAAEEYGFTPVFVETLPWPKQIALFSHARLILGLFGSGLLNALFSSAGARVGAIGRWNLLQSEIGTLRRQENAYLDIEVKLKYSVDENLFRAFLAALTSDASVRVMGM